MFRAGGTLSLGASTEASGETHKVQPTSTQSTMTFLSLTLVHVWQTEIHGLILNIFAKNISCKITSSALLCTMQCLSLSVQRSSSNSSAGDLLRDPSEANLSRFHVFPRRIMASQMCTCEHPALVHQRNGQSQPMSALKSRITMPISQLSCMHPEEYMDIKQVGTYCTQVVSTHPASDSILALSQLK